MGSCLMWSSNYGAASAATRNLMVPGGFPSLTNPCLILFESLIAADLQVEVTADHCHSQAQRLCK